MIFKLKDLVKIKYGKNQKKIECENGKYNILGTGGIIGKTNEFLYNKPSVLIGRKGTIDKIQYVDKPFWTIDTLFYTEINEELVIPQYLYYKLLTIDFKNYNEGTTIPSLRTETLYEIELDIEEKEKQIKIIEILSKLDKKIDLNNHINDNLQEFARCQFYNKFNGKKTNSKFNKLVNLKKKGIKVSTKNKDLGYYPIDTLPMNYLVLKDCKPNEEANSSLIEFSKYDILLGAMRVYFHRVCLASNDGITRNTTFVFEPKSKEYLYYALLLIDKDEFIDYANRTSKGSTMPYAVWEALEEYEIYLPELEDVKIFNDMMHPIFEKMIANEKENQVLMRLRDTLLLKLMNGEIDLDKIEI